MPPIRALEFYSGIGKGSLVSTYLSLIGRHIGGLHLSLSRSTVDADVVQAFDWDQTACRVYTENHGNIVQKVLFPASYVNLRYMS